MNRIISFYKNQPILATGLGIIISILMIRLLSLGLYPYFDTTEARYGETARLMFETQNWVTPFFDYEVPFWGKPPFYVWITALGFSSFGVNEFAGRLPHFLCGLLTLVMVYRFMKTLVNQNAAILAVLILSSSMGFIISSGIVMTDTALLMSVTLSMISFWTCFKGIKPKQSSYLFFASLGLGMLIKGPIAVVLAGIPLVLWSLWQGCFVKAIRAIFWGRGLALFLVITLPWYIWAELRTPGFIEYFIVGEHIKRFLVSGWQGDLYGSAHNEARGTIWLFWLASAFPWSFVLIYQLIKRRFSLFAKPNTDPSVVSYLAIWMLTPMLFFTFAGNILPAYVLPGFGAMAMLLTYLIDHTKAINWLAGVSLVLLTCAITAFSINGAGRNSEYYLLSPVLGDKDKTHVYYWQSAPFSARFYSQGRAKVVADGSTLAQLLAQESHALVAVRHEQAYQVTPLLGDRCQFAGESKRRILFNCNNKF